MPDKETRLFHIGPQKGATTWIYECLKNHGDIRTSDRDTIHYFDMNDHRGRAWYDAQFTHGDGSCYFDPTFTYLRAPYAAKNIHTAFPNAKIMVNLRSPIDRAFAHYWHEKKKGAINVPFTDVFSNYDLYQSWIEPGLYAARLKPYVDAFGVQNILPILMTDIKNNPNDVLNRIYDFAGIKNVPMPEIATQTVNATGAKRNILNQSLYKLGNKITNGKASQNELWRTLGGIENKEDIITPQIHAQLLDIFMPDIVALETMFGINLDAWKQ
jgi:hypothetical protein